MIKNLAAFQRLRVDEDRKALQAMDLTASIAVAEALLSPPSWTRAGHGASRAPVAWRALGIPASRRRRAPRSQR